MIFTPLGQALIVRFARKPLWAPAAKSKLFRINEYKFYTPEEIKKIIALHTVYKSQVYSLKEFMKHEFYTPATQLGGLPKEFVRKEQELDKKTFAENDVENARIGKLREEFHKRHIQELETKVSQEKKNREEKLKKIALEADEQIRNFKSQSDSFVTQENIDAMIESALQNPMSYNFAIDTNGKKIFTEVLKK